MKFFIVLLTGFFLTHSSQSQTSEDSVKAAVNKMFTAMKNADPKTLASTFSDSVVFQTIVTEKNGSLKVIHEGVQDFIDFISQQKPGDADEQIVFETVKVSGPLATVWTPYKFYFKGQFSHCGVNAFQLVRFSGEWKVQYIIDTRMKQGCK